jgi:hypothetical protein
MSLVHLTREAWNETGDEAWRLLDPAGVPIQVFTVFCQKLKGKFATRLRYCIVVARFLDYLYEVGVLGGRPVNRSTINKSIDYYIALLRSGEKISLGIKRKDENRYAEGDEAREAALRLVARRLGITPLSKNSWDNTLAPLNQFLRLCSLLEREAREIALYKGGLDRSVVMTADYDFAPLLEAVEGSTNFSAQEVQFLKQSTLLGGVTRFRGASLTRPNGLKNSFKQENQIDVDSLDFPEAYFPALLTSATSWRDRALWTLLLGTGIRRSEALNLQWCDVDFLTREVFVLDPELLRYGREIDPSERSRRFKGRTVSRTYFRQPYRAWFFAYLNVYRAEEYRLPSDGNDFVFQYLIRPHLGRPWYEATDETLNTAFTSTVVRAQIPGPPVLRSYVWTAHALRHAYGRFMLNDYEVEGQELPGLTEAEVQLLMGHKHISSTRKYAKPRPQRLTDKLIRHDRNSIQGELPAPCVPAKPTVLELGKR